MIDILFNEVPSFHRHGLLLSPLAAALLIAAAFLCILLLFKRARHAGRGHLRGKHFDSKRFASLLETSPHPVLEIDPSGAVPYANSAALRLFPGITGAGLSHPYLSDVLPVSAALRGGDRCSLVREVPVGGLWYQQEIAFDGKSGFLRISGCDITGRKRMEEALKRSEEEFRMLFETMLQGVLYHDDKGRIVSFNPAARAILGISPENMRDGSASLEAVSLDGAPLPAEEHPSMAALATGREVKDRVMGLRPPGAGEYRWLNVTAVPQFRPGESRPYQVYTIFDDITERVRAEKQLRESESRYRQLFESTRDALLLIDADTGSIIDANPSFVSLFGFSHGEIIGKKIDETGIFRNGGEGRHIAVELLHEEFLRRENLSLKAKGGRKIDVEFVSGACLAGTRRVIQCNLRDISERTQAERQIKYLSFHDGVTGLYNRTYFEEELRRLDTNRALPISLIMGDVNNLKLVNDAFGHPEGDKLLIKIAAILKVSCRNEDIVARWGGDEFIILLPRTDEKTAQEIAQRIWKDCAAQKEDPVRPAIALGIASKEKAGIDLREVLKEAEDRMYRNKLIDGKSGRNAIISSLLKTLRERSHETGQHTQRLRKLAMEMADAIGLPSDQVDELALLSVLHDIGKVAIPDEILMKPAPLNPREWKIMVKHPEVGYRIAQSYGALARIADAILAHHERWDGKGYPQGLKSREIPLSARIISIADAYDVMTHGRPYERPVSQKHALDELEKNSGSQFDPDLVKVFVERITRVSTSDPALASNPALLS